MRTRRSDVDHLSKVVYVVALAIHDAGNNNNSWRPHICSTLSTEWRQFSTASTASFIEMARNRFRDRFRACTLRRFLLSQLRRWRQYWRTWSIHRRERTTCRLFDPEFSSLLSKTFPQKSRRRTIATFCYC